MRKLERLGDNRAATPFFQVFGGPRREPPGDAVVMARGTGQHRGERRVLAMLVPLVTGAAVFDGLWRLGGAGLAWVGVLPCAFVLLHVLSFLLGGCLPHRQWRRWELLLTVWVLWQLLAGTAGKPTAPLLGVLEAAGSGVGWAVGLWLLMLGCDMVALLCQLWQALMILPAFCSTRFRWMLAVGVQIPTIVLGWRYGWEWAAAGQAVLATVWACGTFLPNSRLFGPVFRRVEGEGALLSIDDGPDPVDTPVLLDLLDRHGKKAVFFVIGDKVRRYPDLAREIVRRGHQIGNHTMTHPAGTMWCAGSARTRREIVECSRAIEEVTGIKPRWFRAPAGHRNWFTHPVLREQGLELVGWKKRAFDAVRRDVPWIVGRLTTDVRDGDIILLHEATPIAKEVMEGVLTGLE
jgi:peptidoglycan/xylan/chitin deacetylase (PgdA/CDA1 family)